MKFGKLGTFLNEKNIEKCGNAGCKENWEWFENGGYTLQWNKMSWCRLKCPSLGKVPKTFRAEEGGWGGSPS